MSVIEIRSVRLFNGEGLTAPRSIFVENGKFVEPKQSSEVIDGKGFAILLGLIDSHIHLSGRHNLEKALHYGVTALMDMATQDPSVVDSLRSTSDMPNIRSSYRAASPAGSRHTKNMGTPIISSPEEAKLFVKEQLGFGADYIKLIIPDRPESSPFGIDTLKAAVDISHKNNKKVVVHAATTGAYSFIIGSGVDVVTHSCKRMPLASNCRKARRTKYSMYSDFSNDEGINPDIADYYFWKGKL